MAMAQFERPSIEPVTFPTSNRCATFYATGRGYNGLVIQSWILKSFSNAAADATTDATHKIAK